MVGKAKVNRTFPAPICDLVLSIKSINPNQEDKWKWKLHNKGLFSVQSAYAHLIALGKPAVKERVGRYAKCLSVDPTRPDVLVGLDQVSNLVGHDLGCPTCVSSCPAHAQATLKHASLFE
ncbi:4-hydroxy-3-methylbut-2-enyl diphosphatereductase [Striga asiatica]|uniref:4-hydroxy-3-methylbut-2-enyl diphosphatereductase n=1 Tax=Striga asiatica TaxID=4170 RepID=A0A5A7PJ19_STRAF|nr:4-hydroxy-3-methylbut-2-enyl diphosphatereductase [Striga asiatica]